MKKKKRIEIPRELAAEVLFRSDRTCCVCRKSGKPVQIHHIDGDPSNNSSGNLSVLCFDCHRETQICGGFDRKLDGEQVILYRDDWLRAVSRNRVAEEASHAISMEGTEQYIEWVTSLSEIYGEKNDYEGLAVHYDSIGSIELRDKYVDRVLEGSPTDETIIFFRGLQGRPELIPKDVISRNIAWATKNEDWSRKARTQLIIRNFYDASENYVRCISKALSENNPFTAAIYLKEMVDEGLIKELFVQALKKARESRDLWWQIRALQELKWQDELDDLLESSEKEIREQGDPSLLGLLAKAKGDFEGSLEADKQHARETHFGESTFDPEIDALDYPEKS